MLLNVSIIYSLLLLTIISFYRYAIIYLFVHQLMNIWVFSQFLAIMNKAAINIYIWVFGGTYDFVSLKSIPRCEIAGSYGRHIFTCFYKVILSIFNFMFSIVPILFCIPTSNIWEFQLLHVLTSTWYYQRLNFRMS